MSKHLCWTCENCTSAKKCKFVARIDLYYKRHRTIEEMPYIKDISKYYIDGTKTDKQGNITYCPRYIKDNLDHRAKSTKLKDLAKENNISYSSDLITAYNKLLEFEERISLITDKEKQRRQREFVKQVEQKKNNQIKHLNIKNVEFDNSQTNSKPLTKKQLEMKAKREKQEQIAEQKRQAKMLKQELLQNDKEIKQILYYTKDEKQALLSIRDLAERKALQSQYDEYYSQINKIYTTFNFIYCNGHYVRYVTPEFDKATEYVTTISNTMLQKRLLQYINEHKEIYKLEKQRQIEIAEKRSKAQKEIREQKSKAGKISAERRRQKKLNQEQQQCK